MSDLAPYLSHGVHRNMPWTGHAAFPRRSFAQLNKLKRKWPNSSHSLRVFKLRYIEGVPRYDLLSEEKVQQYLDDPTYV